MPFTPSDKPPVFVEAPNPTYQNPFNRLVKTDLDNIATELQATVETTITSNITLTIDSKKFQQVDCTSGDVNITLPSASNLNGKEFIITRIDNSPNLVNLLTILGQTISNKATPRSIKYQNTSMSIKSDNVNWFFF